MATRPEKEANARFSQRYGEERGDVVRAIELAVIGGDWGANGYTTIAQADQLSAILELGTGSLVLDVGAGRGWPGLYLAARRGCSVVMTDVPMEGLDAACERGQRDGLDDRTWPVTRVRVTSRSQRRHSTLWFTPTCCVDCGQSSPVDGILGVLRPGGRTAFHTIHTAPGLDRRARARANRSGPWAVASTDAPVELLRRAFAGRSTTQSPPALTATPLRRSPLPGLVAGSVNLVLGLVLDGRPVARFVLAALAIGAVG